MKHIITLPVFLLLTSQLISAQKVERYCELLTNNISKWRDGSKGPWVVSLVTGDVDSVSGYRDSAELAALTKVAAFHNEIDALNYMDSIGWTLVATTTVTYTSHFFFKKRLEPPAAKQR